MADLDLDAIEARANAATPGPWESLDGGDRLVAWRQRDDELGIAAFDYVVPEPLDNEADAEFIAYARTDVPALVAEVRRLREESAKATAWHLEALDDLARAVRALDTSKAIASERRARVNRLVEAVERERAERLALTALLNAKQSWIDGAKVDMAAMEEELAKALAAIALAGEEIERDWRRRYEALRDGVLAIADDLASRNALVLRSAAPELRAVVARVEGDES